MTHVSLNGIELNYEVRGEGPAVVLAHGVGGNSLGWWQQVRQFGERYRTIMFDHRSFGQSTDDGRGAGAFVDDLEALLDHLGVEEVALVGQSMGGFTCAGYAVRHPERVRALVLSGSVAGLTPPPPDEMVAPFLARAENWADFVHAEVARGGFPERSPDLYALYELMSTLNLRATGDILRTIIGVQYDIAPLVAADIPVLLLNGEEDEKVGEVMGELASRFPRGSHATITDSGHLAYFERADEFNRIVLDFLGRHVAPLAAAAAGGNGQRRP